MHTLKILFYLALGLSLAGFGWTMHQNEQSDIRQAVEVEGTVESSGVELQVTDQRSGTGHYEVVVGYSYTYEGQDYTSESVYPGPEAQFRFEEEAREVANRFSPGQTTTVYVNEERPSRAFLIEETGGNLVPVGMMGFGALILLGLAGNVAGEFVGALRGG